MLELFSGLPEFGGVEEVPPGEIERRSMDTIRAELSASGVRLDAGTEAVVLRAVHATADFDFARNLVFTPGAMAAAADALSPGGVVVTDTNMALAGVSAGACGSLGVARACFMADGDVAEAAASSGLTRAACAVDKAAREFGGRRVVYAVGNAPTALVRLRRLWDAGIFRPSLIIAAPVGFVNVVAAKRLVEDCAAESVVARGRKGGSSVAAAIVNALLYGILGR